MKKQTRAEDQKLKINLEWPKGCWLPVLLFDSFSLQSLQEVLVLGELKELNTTVNREIFAVENFHSRIRLRKLITQNTFYSEFFLQQIITMRIILCAIPRARARRSHL